MSRRVRIAGLGLLFLGALALRGSDLNWGLPEVYEEATPVREAVEFWGSPGGALDLNPHFFKYPSLTFYMNFGLQAVQYFWLSLAGSIESLNEFRQFLDQDLASVVLLSRWLQGLLGALLVIPVFVLAFRLTGEGAAWIAALLIAVLPVAVAESRLVSPDVASNLFSACCLAACAGVVRHGRREDALWAGLWLGLAASAKYPGALLMVPLGAALAVRAQREGQGAARGVVSLSLWEALAVAGIVFFVTSPYVLLDGGAFLDDLRFEQRHMQLGHLGREGGRAWTFYLGHAIPLGWTPVVGAAALLGLAGLLARRSSRGAAIPGLLFAAVLLLILGSWRMAAARYALALTPLAAAWAGAAVALAASRLQDPRARSWAVGVAALALIAWPLSRSLVQVRAASLVDSRSAAKSWIVETVPVEASLLVERYGPELRAGNHVVLQLPFHGVTPHLYDPAYSPVFYSSFDFVVLSSGVHARYLAKPREYPAQTAFYRTLDRGFREVKRFEAGEYLGPTIRVLERRSDGDLGSLADVPESFFDQLQGNRPLAEYFSKLGTALVRQGEAADGFRMLQTAVDMDGENALTWGNLGAMQMREGDFESALQSLRRAREFDPDDPRVHINLAVLFAREGELSQSADAYRTALSLAPDDEGIYVGLARVLIESVRYSEARLILNEFLNRFPRSPRRPSVESALAGLRDMGPGRP